MLSLEEVRASLPNDKEYTDEEVIEIRDSLYELASICFDKWLYDKNKKHEG